MKKFLIYILLILLVFPKYAYSIRIMGFDTTSPMGTTIVHGAASVIYGVLFAAAKQMDDLMMQGAMFAGLVGTTLELGFRKAPRIKTYIDRTQHPRAAIPLKVCQSIVGYAGGKAAENAWISDKKGLSSRLLLEPLAHAVKGGSKSIVRNVPLVVHLYFFRFPQLDGFVSCITLSVAGEGVGTVVKNWIQGKEIFQLKDLTKSMVSSGVVRFLANMVGEEVVGWKNDPVVGIFSELMVYRTKRQFGEGTKKFPELIDQQDISTISEIPQPLNFLNIFNFTLDGYGSLQILPSQFLSTAEPDALFEPDLNPSSFRSYRIVRIYDVADGEEDSSGGTKFVLEVEERGKCFYRPLMWDTNTSQLISPDKFPLDLKHEDKGVRLGL
ncbi:MAG: hypothetical protein LBB37_00155 [Endomicrobium sp.]|jgi:hypothetical protein|nr:hypothetical protein [Endomicrobium sp.]